MAEEHTKTDIYFTNGQSVTVLGTVSEVSEGLPEGGWIQFRTGDDEPVEVQVAAITHVLPHKTFGRASFP